jgi:hypothetical protein
VQLNSSIVSDPEPNWIQIQSDRGSGAKRVKVAPKKLINEEIINIDELHVLSGVLLAFPGTRSLLEFISNFKGIKMNIFLTEAFLTILAIKPWFWIRIRKDRNKVTIYDFTTGVIVLIGTVPYIPTTVPYRYTSLRGPK